MVQFCMTMHFRVKVFKCHLNGVVVGELQEIGWEDFFFLAFSYFFPPQTINTLSFNIDLHRARRVQVQPSCQELQ